MNPWLNHMQSMTRRQLFQQAGMGMGFAGLSSVLTDLVLLPARHLRQGTSAQEA